MDVAGTGPRARVLLAGGRKSALGEDLYELPTSSDWAEEVELYTPCTLTPGPCE